MSAPTAASLSELVEAKQKETGGGRKRKAKVYTELTSPEDFKKTASKESITSMNRIKIFRAILLMCLVTAGVVSGVLSFKVLRKQEHQKYESEFNAILQEIFVAVDEGFQSKIVTLDHMSTISSFTCPDAAQWPNCSIEMNYFEALTSSLVDLSMSRSISSNPLVFPHQQDGFEAFAYDLFTREGYPEDTGISSFGQGIFRNGADGREPDNGTTTFSPYELLLPVFQPAELQSNWRGIMFNMHSEIVRATAIDAVLDCAAGLQATQASGTSVVQRCSSVSDFIQLVSDPTPRPASIIYSPIFPLHDNTTVVGVVAVIFNWDELLTTTEITDGNTRLKCVVETSVGDNTLHLHSFEVGYGQVSYLGAGADYNGRDDHVAMQLSYGAELATSVKYTLHFGSTDHFYREHHTSTPIFASVACACIIILISALFFAYDMLVKREAVENKLLLDSKRVFVKFVSHEIRTPINTVTLGLQLLHTRLAALDASLLLPPLTAGVATTATNSPSPSPRWGGGGGGLASKRRSSSGSSSKAVVAECLDLVEDLTESSKTAVVVLNELINYDKIEMDKFHVERRLCDVFLVLQDTFHPLELQAKQRKVALSMKKEVGTPKSLFVIGDALKLGQVIRNVLSNALKFAPVKGTVTVSVRWDQVTNPPAEDLLVRLDPVTGAEYRAAGDVVVAVVDTGPGLSLEQQQQMFREGVQFNANELQAGQGSGLGLWISREIMKQHGGVISVSSEGLGKGSTFTITVPVLLPLVSKDRVTNSGPQQFKRSASLTMERVDVLSVEIPRRVLIVDDAVSSVKILNRLLVNAGMEVTNAYDGSEGIDRVNQCPHETMFDLIIMDFEMPIMNGPEATHTLRNAGHRMPIIGVTGNVLPEDRDYFLACGADWVLPKPLNMTALLNAYSDVVAERREEAHQQTTADAEDDSPA